MTLLWMSVALADTLEVGAGQAYGSIEHAVDDASDFDTIVLHPGTYTESIEVEDSLMFLAAGPGVDWIGVGNGPALEIDDDEVVRVEGIRFSHGSARCVEAHGGAYLEVVDSLFDGCGTSGNSGGSIHVDASSRLVVRNSTFTNGTGATGGFIRSGGPIVIVGSTFDGATAGSSGGAVYAEGSFTIVGSMFRNNSAGSSGGAVYSTANEPSSILTSRFEDNSAGSSGGAVYLTDDRVDIVASRFCDNDAASSGGAVYRGSANDMVLANNLFARNHSGSSGGGVDFSSGSGSQVLHNVFYANTANGSGGGLDTSGGWTVRHNVFLENDPSGYRASSGPTHEHNVYFGNVLEDLDGPALDTTEVVADPLLASVGATVPCDQLDVHPLVGSPLIDGGDPTLLDADGSTADIGVHGGLSDPDNDGDADGVPEGADCDDADATRNPGANERCNQFDDNCNGVADGPDVFDITTATPIYEDDDDSDGFAGVNSDDVWACLQPGDLTQGGDCDDGDALVYPGAPELCDGLDNDCDAGTPDPPGPHAFWPDDDDDGQGDSTAPPEYPCVAPSGLAPNDDDCDDADDAVYLGAPEQCDTIDNDCDGTVDEDVVFSDYWPDTDDDGFGDGALAPVSTCDGAPDDHADNPDDCDDADDSIGGPRPFYVDLDGDGFGDPNSVPVVSCVAVSGFVDDDTDCDDSDPAIHPDTVWYHDSDGDLAGDPLDSEVQCDAPASHVLDDSDCDDSDPDVQAEMAYVDADEDGFGAGSLEPGCPQNPGFSDNDADCDDTDDAVNPDADERCNLDDDDCDGLVDEDAVDRSPSWPDVDGDGFGDAEGATLDECEPGVGRVGNGDDCDDANSSVNPDADDVAGNGIDEDCDGDDDAEGPDPDPDPDPDDGVSAPELWFCATASPGTAASTVLFALMLGLRRRVR